MIWRNRAYLEVRGKVSEAGLTAWAKDAARQLARLQLGFFSMVSDVLECTLANEAGQQWQIIQDLQRKVHILGTSRVVRITRDANPVTANQWQPGSRTVGCIALDAATVVEPDALLDAVVVPA